MPVPIKLRDLVERDILPPINRWSVGKTLSSISSRVQSTGCSSGVGATLLSDSFSSRSTLLLEKAGNCSK